jgi:hypothetical protein
MIQPLVLNDLDLWEAWIEFDLVDPNNFGTLYILGEVLTDKKQPSIMLSRSVSNTDPKRLILRVDAKVTGNAVKPTEVMYSETITSVSDYEAVSIYSGDVLLAEFNEIEVLI